ASRRRCLSRRTQDGLTRYFWATAEVAVPASQSASTRSRRSIEYGFMAHLQEVPSVLPHRRQSRYTNLETALNGNVPDRIHPVGRVGRLGGQLQFRHAPADGCSFLIRERHPCERDAIGLPPLGDNEKVLVLGEDHPP